MLLLKPKLAMLVHLMNALRALCALLTAGSSSQLGTEWPQPNVQVDRGVDIVPFTA
jgi:hypothetical protein